MGVWIGFIVFVLICLAFDLGVVNRKAHVIKPKEAGIWTSVWVGLALLFSVVIWWLFSNGLTPNPTALSPTDAVIDYITGYLVELSLSIDNVFVIAVIFSAFKIPAQYQHRVLFWGILGAIVFRALMIVFGVALITKFHWIIYVFGVILLYTAYTMLKGHEDSDPTKSWLYKKIINTLRVTDIIDGQKFFITKDAKKYATPLFVALVIVEITDVMFALDSIPAILAITQDEFIVFSSNILAILGLRSMFFLIVGLIEKFRFINYSLVVILGFVGMKMLLTDVIEIPSWISLIVIVLALAGGILASSFIKTPEIIEDVSDLIDEEVDVHL